VVFLCKNILQPQNQFNKKLDFKINSINICYRYNGIAMINVKNTLAIIALLLNSAIGIAQTMPAQPTLFSNIPYGPSSEQIGDFYVPGGNLPIKGLLIWIHGGGWQGGDKNDPDIENFAPAFYKGLAVLSINYRLNGSGAFPNSANDVEILLDEIETSARNCYNCSHSRYPTIWNLINKYSQNGLAVAGGSSGGYLAVAGAGSYLVRKTNENSPTNLKCINNNVGPVDLRKFNQYPDISQSILNSYSSYDLSLKKLSEMSPNYYTENGVLNKSARKVTWILNYNNGDNLIPPQLQSGFTQNLRNLGANVISNIANDPRNTDGGHNLTEQTKKLWLSQVAKICFGV